VAQWRLGGDSVHVWGRVRVRGFAHATEWCDHHAEVIQPSIDSMLSSFGV
jgi:hypothetical protein